MLCLQFVVQYAKTTAELVRVLYFICMCLQDYHVTRGLRNLIRLALVVLVMGLVVGFTAGKYLSDDNLAKSTTTKREENVSLLTADQVGRPHPHYIQCPPRSLPLPCLSGPSHKYVYVLRLDADVCVLKHTSKNVCAHRQGRKLCLTHAWCDYAAHQCCTIPFIALQLHI